MAISAKSAFRLQPRDVEILAAVGEYGLLDTQLIAERWWPTAKGPRACQERLSDLFKQGYLERHEFAKPVATKKGRRTPTKLPVIFRLKPAGAEIVEKQTGRNPPRPGRNQAPEPLTLLHRLGVVRTRIILDQAFADAGLPLPEWIHEQDTVPGARTNEPMSKRFVLYEAFRKPTTRCVCRPDAEAKIHIPDTEEDCIASLEYDLSTVELADMVDKLDGYDALWKTEAYRKRWSMLGKHAVRALFVCKSQERIENLCKAFAGHEAAPNVRLTTASELTVGDALYTPIWRNTAGTCLRMLRPKT